jgi:hypothetical protein
MLAVAAALVALVACGSRTGLDVDVGAARAPSPVEDTTFGQDAGATVGPDVDVPARDAGRRDAPDVDALVDAHDANAFDAPFDANACPVCMAPYGVCKMTQGINGSEYQCCAPGSGPRRCCLPGVGSITIGSGCPSDDGGRGIVVFR